MPAVNEIDADNFHKIMNNRLFDFWLVREENKKNVIPLMIMPQSSPD